jgi:hypothetical protein
LLTATNTPHLPYSPLALAAINIYNALKSIERGGKLQVHVGAFLNALFLPLPVNELYFPY